MKYGPAVACIGVLLVVPIAIISCGSSARTVRVGPPVELETGQPTNECEMQQCLNMAPAFSSSFQSETMAAGHNWVEVTTVSEKAPGYAVYLKGQDEPLDLLTLIPRMDEPTLDDHVDRIDGILSRQHKATKLGRISAVMAGVGIGVMLAGTPDIGVVMAGTGICVASLVPFLWGTAIRPNPYERTYAFTRQYTFVTGEDDMDAVARGVTRLNGETREQCGSQW